LILLVINFDNFIFINDGNGREREGHCDAAILQLRTSKSYGSVHVGVKDTAIAFEKDVVTFEFDPSSLRRKEEAAASLRA
jgi:hypothetical protein